MRKLLSILLFLSSSVFAQSEWPNKPINLVVAQAAGSSPDIIARAIAEKMSQYYKQQVIVMNRPGMASISGTEYFLKLPSDGYNWILTFTGTLVLNKFLFNKLPYDPSKDFDIVYKVGTTGIIIAASTKLPINNVNELIAYSRTRPNGITYGTSNTRNLTHFTGDIFMTVFNINATHVPFKGSAQGILDTVSGNVDIFIDAIPPMSPWINSNKLRPLAVTTQRRMQSLPDVPTLNELKKNIVITGTFYIALPNNSSTEMQQKINMDLNKVLSSQDMKEKLTVFGFLDNGGSLMETKQFVEQENNIWNNLIKFSTIKPE